MNQRERDQPDRGSGDPERIDRLAPTRQPQSAPSGYQTWSDLLFVHWRIPLERLRPLVPRCLDIDTFDGSAWLGLVPFHMSHVRPFRWLPEIPGTSAFHETNLRTYVHHQGRDPGVWFFSLDAANRLAVEVARRAWSLNYYFARMNLLRGNDQISYRSTRTDRRSHVAATVEIEASIGPPLFSQGFASGTVTGTDSPTAAPRLGAPPGSLEHFLAERYLLYCIDGGGQLRQGRVYHTPYPLRSATLNRLHQTISDAAGIPSPGEPDSVLFSDGVTVDIHQLRHARE